MVNIKEVGYDGSMDGGMDEEGMEVEVVVIDGDGDDLDGEVDREAT